MPKVDVSIIVCHHKGEFLYKFIESVRKSEGVTYEIIVVTSDADVALQGIKGCRVWFDAGMPAAKRNKGARLAYGKYLAFFDDDVEIEPLCLYEFKKSLERDLNIGMVYGKLHKADEPHRFDEAGGYLTSTGFIWSRAGQNEIDYCQYDKVEPILAGKSASCMCTRAAFGGVRGFDESFEILGEETDLSWRMWLQGFKVMFIPEAVGIHYFNTKFKPAKEYYNCRRVNYNGCRNYLTMLAKNLGHNHLWIVPLHLLIWFIASLAMVGTLKVEQGWNIMKGIGYFIRNMGIIIRKRKVIQEKRVIDERDLWPIIHHKTPRGYYKQRFLRYITLGLHG